MFPSFGFKPPTNESPASSQQPTSNRPSLKANGDWRRDYRRQYPDTAKPALATESAVSSPSTTLTERLYFL